MRPLHRVVFIRLSGSFLVKCEQAFSISDGTLVLSANSPESGSATEELEVSYSGEELEIGFNSRYLLDITQQIGGDNAQLTMADAASPTILRQAGDASALYVLMPMRV